MNIPNELLYTKTHEWVQDTDGGVRVGLSDFAQNTMGDLVFVNLPNIGDCFAVGDIAADVESVKAVSDIFCPVAGTVTDVNEDLLATPEIINSNPYGAWLFELSDVSGKEDLLNAKGYEAAVAAEEA